MAAKRAVAGRRPTIVVIAGVNGAGKSSIGGARLRTEGSNYFNPDEAARLARARNPELTQRQANSLAWQTGKRLLEQAIRGKKDFHFESTLGGNSITALLIDAARQGYAIHIWYAGLATMEQHVRRVSQRVKQGGHDIPKEDIQRRWSTSRLNLVRLLPHLARLRVYDNSHEADPSTGSEPRPILILDYENGSILAPSDLKNTPHWAKPMVAAAIKISQAAMGPNRTSEDPIGN